eukprot:NODE_14388_length_1112_cov_2.387817.p1 GENE.NODE_14388_length_1112_cov_2.387817~~NODE_14388_length_1112_cov_2.387817.p1  ORF type:complete len:163 (-),score=24.36 NODE_14388_length_1112_cov_2.387817:538-1026(-)
MPPRERGYVTNWFRQRGYGFVSREGRSCDDIQLHVESAKGSELKAYIRKNGLRVGAKVKFAVDYEEHKGKPFAAEWELLDGPSFRSRSRSCTPRQRGSPSYGRSSVRRRRHSPSDGDGSAVQRARSGTGSPVRALLDRKQQPRRSRSRRRSTQNRKASMLNG